MSRSGMADEYGPKGVWFCLDKPGILAALVERAQEKHDGLPSYGLAGSSILHRLPPRVPRALGLQMGHCAGREGAGPERVRKGSVAAQAIAGTAGQGEARWGGAVMGFEVAPETLSRVWVTLADGLIEIAQHVARFGPSPVKAGRWELEYAPMEWRLTGPSGPAWRFAVLHGHDLRPTMIATIRRVWSEAHEAAFDEVINAKVQNNVDGGRL